MRHKLTPNQKGIVAVSVVAILGGIAYLLWRKYKKPAGATDLTTAGPITVTAQGGTPVVSTPINTVVPKIAPVTAANDPILNRDVKAFQAWWNRTGWSAGNKLVVDGKNGPKTSAAWNKVVSNGQTAGKDIHRVNK